VARVLVAGRVPTGVTAVVEDRVQQRIGSEFPVRLLGVVPGVVEVRQQPARGVIVHVRIEVDRDVAGRSGQVEQLVVLEPVLPPRQRRTAVHAPILSRRTDGHEIGKLACPTRRRHSFLPSETIKSTESLDGRRTEHDPSSHTNGGEDGLRLRQWSSTATRRFPTAQHAAKAHIAAHIVRISRLRDAGAADHRSSMAHMKCSGARCPERTNPIEVGPERTRSGGVDSVSSGLKETAAWVS